MMRSMTSTRPTRSLLIILGVTALLVVVSLVVVFSRGEPEALPADTPEGVVQRYATAVVAGDDATAIGYLTPAVEDDCERFSELPGYRQRVVLVSTSERGATADVWVSIATTYEGNGPFGSSEFVTEERFELVTVDGQWRITRSPRDLAVCMNAATTS